MRNISPQGLIAEYGQREKGGREIESEGSCNLVWILMSPLSVAGGEWMKDEASSFTPGLFDQSLYFTLSLFLFVPFISAHSNLSIYLYFPSFHSPPPLTLSPLLLMAHNYCQVSATVYSGQRASREDVFCATGTNKVLTKLVPAVQIINLNLLAQMTSSTTTWLPASSTRCWSTGQCNTGYGQDQMSYCSLLRAVAGPPGSRLCLSLQISSDWVPGTTPPTLTATLWEGQSVTFTVDRSKPQEVGLNSHTAAYAPMEWPALHHWGQGGAEPGHSSLPD